MAPGSHLLRHPEKMRKLLVEGLCQAEVDCVVPKVTVYRHLRDFLREEARDTSCDNFRIIAHPPLQEYNSSKAEQTIAAPVLNSTAHRRQPVQSVDNLAPADDQLAARGRFVKSPDSLRFSQYTSLLRADISTASSSSVTQQRGDSIYSSNAAGSGECAAQQARGMVIAVGPEGGWTTEEVQAFQRRGYQLVNLGPRILRTDIAVRETSFYLARFAKSDCGCYVLMLQSGVCLLLMLQSGVCLLLMLQSGVCLLVHCRCRC
jgi:16S rRNA U1498 N3-methylase RsmE